MSKTEDNAKLLDSKGEWIEASDTDTLAKYNGKAMIGFLADSNYNVVGFMSKGISRYVSMNGYYCSHFRELIADEIYSLVGYKEMAQCES